MTVVIGGHLLLAPAPIAARASATTRAWRLCGLHSRQPARVPFGPLRLWFAMQTNGCTNTARATRLRLKRLLGQPERGSLGVSADRPVIPRMDDASTERLDAVQRLADVAHGEVGQRKGVPRPTSALVHTDRRAVRAGLPSLPLARLARVQLYSQKLCPEAPSTLEIVRGELDQRQRGAGHRSHDNGLTWMAAAQLGTISAAALLPTDRQCPGEPG